MPRGPCMRRIVVCVACDDPLAERLDDIHDVIATKRRAHQRTRLTHRRGNVWSFTGAPKYIVNP